MIESPETRSSLIGGIKNLRNHEAWSEFIEIYTPVISGIVARHRLGRENADEITQEILCRVAISIGKYDHGIPNRSFRGWLYRVAQNLTIDFLRASNKQQSIRKLDSDFDISQLPDPSDEEADDFLAEYKRQLFSWATERVRSSFKNENWLAFRLSAVNGQTIEEVASELNMEIGQVYVARSRVMARIRKLVHGQLDHATAETLLTDE